MSNIALNVKDTVKALTGSIKTMVPDISALVLRLKKDLLEPIRTSENASTSTETQTPPNNRDIDPLIPLHSTGPDPDLLRVNPR